MCFYHGKSRRTEHIEEYELAEAKLSQEYEQIQTADDCFQILEKVAPLHHAAKSLYNTMQAAREAIPQDRDLIDLRDRAYDLERTLDLLSTDTQHALNYRMAKQAEEEAKLSKQSLELANRLNILAAIFFPLMALSSIFGMNLHSGFENSSTWAFWIILLAGVLLGVGMSLWALRGSFHPKTKEEEGKKKIILSR